MALCVCIALGLVSNAVAMTVANNHPVPTIAVANDVVGIWDYEVSGTEEAYRTGMLDVGFADGKPSVAVHLQYGVLNGADVKIAGNKVEFTVLIEGSERVTVALTADGDTISGTASSSQGTMQIKGTRKEGPK